ncbi:DUF1800 domain-containing protein [Pseudomonas sp. CCI3.2]|uniref:DUF1800 domain-containing protein n=1 Tax=unclassified Pseudomonas TaxID=196821 RepID=UPI002AC8A725|nr:MULTISPECIES: DUF1800 domain-containing protein [unclassified Pseudomonas]MEB0079657.1 DUF1800 domain-containing protein [Pseudomonas sp. MH10out]MEB0093402.1 DUF1800 domain-containing protein [Pseudomonas sp. CCI4.2]MEB0102281.1 DUF1800 domain-containing protein [Pseudomonas sp. CCI3.2]MEB0129413.1 DUF1800 domain-containing protein [Pseudomonas sp. CCI2.4]MEB0160578.1 DUF1800 domain-containing protein [Pseudomonas sp. AH2 (2023)]
MPASSIALRPLCVSVCLLLLAPSHAMASAPVPLNTADIAWLRRDGFDLDAASVTRLRSMGRAGLLEAQLTDRIPDLLPPAINTLLHGYPALTSSLESSLIARKQEQEQLNAMPDGDDKIAAKKAAQQAANEYGQQAQEIVMLRAVYGPNQLKEQLISFWLNHFSIYMGKGRVRWMAADYEEQVIRPHALGKFKDLVMATLKSPAMLEFLDNAQNAQGKVNENYARELMELHTLGVGSGYTQQDVQQLALILTGAGLAPLDGKQQRFPPALAPFVVQEGVFEFNPKRHDFSDKVLLGQPIRGSGFDEIAQAVELITRQKACAVFISHQLAQYFVADNPPQALVDRMAATFQRTDGDIAQVMRTLFQSKELQQSAGTKFKDPIQFVASSVRLAYDGKTLANARPMVNWLNQLGEPVFGRVTPDGWPLDSSGWTSSGQLSKRFEIARIIGRGDNRLFTPEGSPKEGIGFPMITTRLFYDAVAPGLSAATRGALDQAASQQEWNTYLLSSPDFNSR